MLLLGREKLGNTSFTGIKSVSKQNNTCIVTGHLNLVYFYK